MRKQILISGKIDPKSVSVRWYLVGKKRNIYIRKDNCVNFTTLRNSGKYLLVQMLYPGWTPRKSRYPELPSWVAFTKTTVPPSYNFTEEAK